MIDDIGCEYLDSVVISKLLSIMVDFNIEAEDTSVFLLDCLTTETGHGFHHIFLVEGSNIDVRHRNLALLQEFEQCFKGSEG